MDDKGMDTRGTVAVKTRMTFMEKLGFVKAMYIRHFYLWKRFKVSAIVGTVGSVSAILTFYFLNMVIQPSSQHFAQYGFDFFSFVLIGVAFFAYANICISLFRNLIHETYFNNWLEIVMSSPLKFHNYVASVTFRALVSATTMILLYITIGVILGAELVMPSNVLLLILVVLLAITAICGLGLMSGSMFLLFNVKGESEPIYWFVLTFAGLVSGSFFPPELFLDIFPPLYYLSRLFPHTYALDAIRRLLSPALTDASMAVVLQDVGILCIFASVLLTLGAFMFREGLRKAEREGKLAKWGA